MELTEEHPEVFTHYIFTFYDISAVTVVGSMFCSNIEWVAVKSLEICEICRYIWI